MICYANCTLPRLKHCLPVREYASIGRSENSPKFVPKVLILVQNAPKLVRFKKDLEKKLKISKTI